MDLCVVVVLSLRHLSAYDMRVMTSVVWSGGKTYWSSGCRLLCSCLASLVSFGHAVIVTLTFVCLLFFFFKQKTAYEMRISDWSSDVCSSDLRLSMPFLELSLYARQADHARYEAALEDIGALSVTLMDANADAADEQAILEPGVGETPLWAELLVTALFPAGYDPDLILAALEAFDAGLDLRSVRVREVPDQDWERVWMADYQPLAFGKRTFIVPWNRELPDAASGADAAVVRLDPGLAFGSGTHPTTALCLEWLDGLDLTGKAVLDFGSGSGILALAALKLGAAEAVAVDNDPQALLATADNAERNAVADRLRVYLPADEPVRRYPVEIGRAHV